MSTTISRLWQQFTAERSVALSPSTLGTDYSTVQKWLARCPIQELDRGREVMTWVLQQDPPYSALKVGRYVKTLYSWASSEGVRIVSFNPVSNYKFPKKEQCKDIVVISKAEIPVLLEALKPGNRPCARWDQMALFMLQTGMRTGEARAVRVADVQGDMVLVHCNYTCKHGLKTSTKTNKKRLVPLNAVAKGVLELMKPDEEGYFFPWSRSAFEGYFHDRMRLAVEQGKLGRIYRPYDLRHTAISQWLETVPVTQAAQWAGNSAEVIWNHYAGTTQTYEMPVL